MLGTWSGIFGVVGEVVALRLPAGVGNGGVCLVGSESEAQTCLGVEEVIVFVDVERLIDVGAVASLAEFVVVAVGIVLHVAVLQVGKCIPVPEEAVGGLQISAVVVFVSVGVVIPIVLAARAHGLVESFVGDVGQKSVVIATELLQVYSARYVPALVFVVHIVDSAVGMLGEAFVTYEIGFLELRSVRGDEDKA